MRHRVVGYLTDHHLSLHLYRAGRFSPLGVFGDDDSRDAIAPLLSREVPLHLLVDVIEMDFRLESVPHLHGRDRRDLRGRKLAQTFRETPFRLGLSLGREILDKKRERLLLSAVTNPDLIQPWLDVLRDAHIPLSGITALPYLLAEPARRLWRLQAHFLLVTHESRAGLRLSYFQEGDLLFSRLAAHEGDAETLAVATREEVARTQQYLASLRLLERDRPLTIWCVMPEAARPIWERELYSTPLLQFECVTLAEMAHALRLPAPAIDRDFEGLTLELLARGRFPNHLANGEARHHYHVHLLRRGLNVATAGLALSTALGIGYTAWVAADQHALGERLQAEAHTLEQRYQALRAAFPTTEATAEEIKGTVELARGLAAEADPSRRLLARLSRGFDAVPEARLERLLWLKSPRPENESALELPQSDAPTAAAGVTDPAATPSAWVALLEGSLEGGGEPRAALERLERLRQAVAAEGIRVEVLQAPVDVRPESRLTGGVAAPESHRYVFRLRVTWVR